MNKLDRDGRDPLDLIAELEDVLGIEGYPMNWPIGMGKELKGLYDRYHNRVAMFRPDSEETAYVPLDDDGDIPADNPLHDDSWYEDARDNMELIEDAGNAFDMDKIAKGDQTPVFFGSALANFGSRLSLRLICSLRRSRKNTRRLKVTKLNQRMTIFLVLCLRFKRTWTRSTGTESRLCGSVPAALTMAWTSH